MACWCSSRHHQAPRIFISRHIAVQIDGVAFVALVASGQAGLAVIHCVAIVRVRIRGARGARSNGLARWRGSNQSLGTVAGVGLTAHSVSPVVARAAGHFAGLADRDTTAIAHQIGGCGQAVHARLRHAGGRVAREGHTASPVDIARPRLGALTVREYVACSASNGTTRPISNA